MSPPPTTLAEGSAAPPEPGSSTFDWLRLASLAIMAGIIFATYRDFGVTWDEAYHVTYGDYIRDYFASGGVDTAAITYRQTYLYGGAYDLAGAFVRGFATIDPYHAMHLFGALVGLAGIAVVGRWARLLGGPLAGLCATLLLAVTPAYWGHMFANPKDTPFAVGYALALYAITCVAMRAPSIPRRLWTLLGVALGLAVCVRIAGLLTLCYLLLSIAIFAVHRGWVMRRPSATIEAGWRALPGVLWATAIAWATMIACWPWALQGPLSRPIEALRAMSKFILFAQWRTFNGETMFTLEVPWDYLPRYFLYKTPELILVLLLLGSALALSYAFRSAARAQIPFKQAHGLALVAISTILPVVFAIIKGSVLYDGLRHFLFIAMPIAVAAGVTAAYVVSWAYRRRMWIGHFAVGLLVLAFAVQLRTTVYMHPVQYTWFNSLVGGLPGAQGNFDVEYYGGSFREAVRLLAEELWETEPETFLQTTYTVSGCISDTRLKTYLPPNFSVAKRPDFALGSTRNECHQRHPNAPEIATVERFGVTLNSVRDLRPQAERAAAAQRQRDERRAVIKARAAEAAEATAAAKALRARRAMSDAGSPEPDVQGPTTATPNTTHEEAP